MTSNTNIQYYKNVQVEYAEPANDVVIKVGCNDLTDKGIVLDYDLVGVPKRFKINPSGMNWTDGINTFNTNLDKICALEIALPALQIAPNSTTMKLNNTLLLDDGANKSITVDATTPVIIMDDGIGTSCALNNSSLSFDNPSGTPITLDANTPSLNITNGMNTTLINPYNISTSNVDLITINGMTPITTIGLTWANILDQNLAWSQLGTSGYGFNNYSGQTSHFNIDEITITDGSTGYYTTMIENGIQLANTSSNYFGILSILGSNTFAMDSSNGVAIIGDANNNSNTTRLVVNDGHREIDLNCVDLLNAYSGSQPAVMTPSFTNKQGGNINYGGGNSWQNVASNNMNIPDFLFTQTNGLYDWKLEFSLNCRNMNNQTDKALALYIEFLDNVGHSFEPFNFNVNQPFTSHKNNSTYSLTSNQSENYCWSDYVNFNGATGSPFTINLWWSADNNLSCDFSWVLSLTKTNLL